MTPSDPALSDRAQEIRARCEQATKGPWTVSEDYDQAWNKTGYGRVFADGDDEIVEYINVEDCFFIAHAREDIPWLLDQLLAAQEEAANREGVITNQAEEIVRLIHVVEKAEARITELESALRAQASSVSPPVPEFIKVLEGPCGRCGDVNCFGGCELGPDETP